MANIIIYVMFDPIDGAIRYVGKTQFSIQKRLAGHLNKQSGARCGNWIASVVRAGRVPGIACLEVCYYATWRSRERFWIAYFRWAGARLCNLSDGGDGASGYSHTADAKARISAANKCKTRPAISAKVKGVPKSAAHGAAISRAKKGHVVISDKQRVQISAALTGRKASKETRERLRGRVCTAAHRQKLSDAARKQWADGRGHNR